MTYLQSIPQGIDAFSEGLSSFENQELVQSVEPTAAVQSASNNSVKKVTIIEPPSFMNDTKNESVVAKPHNEGEDEGEGEGDLVQNLKDFYNDNQTIILVGLVVAVAFYYHKKKNN
jgi:hypothetical protein